MSPRRIDSIEIVRIAARDASIAVRRLGAGPPVVFAHCSGGSHRAWLFAARALAGRHRSHLPDLIGYGDSSRHLDAFGTPIDCTDAEAVAAVIEAAGSPAHVIAHSFGAAACLEAARLSSRSIASMLLIEPPAFHLLREKPSARRELEQIRRLAVGVIAAMDEGRTRRAARHYMSFWIGALRWAMAPRAMRREVYASMSKVAADFELVESLDPSLASFAELDVPVTLVCGGRSPAPARAVVRALATALPDSRVVTLPTAGHMSPFTHRERVLEVIDEHLARAGAGAVKVAAG